MVNAKQSLDDNKNDSFLLKCMLAIYASILASTMLLVALLQINIAATLIAASFTLAAATASFAALIPVAIVGIIALTFWSTSSNTNSTTSFRVQNDYRTPNMFRNPMNNTYHGHHTQYQDQDNFHSHQHGQYHHH